MEINISATVSISAGVRVIPGVSVRIGTFSSNGMTASACLNVVVGANVCVSKG